MGRLGRVGLVWMVLGAVLASGQTVAPKPQAAADAGLDLAEALIGRALFLRGFYLADDLSYDAAGKVIGAPKVGDWTVAGMDVQKAERQGQAIELSGVRVVIRYNPDNHEFVRRPQKDEAVKVRLADGGSGLAAALDAVFAQGIDPRLQQAMPAFWQHYFNPGLAYPQDGLSGQTVLAANLPGDVTPPNVVHKTEAKMTIFAERERVRGTLQLRLVVDSQGVPRRIAVARPLGYGLEERAVEAVGQWRFTPATRGGQPVAAAVVVNYDFAFCGAAASLTPPPPKTIKSCEQRT